MMQSFLTATGMPPAISPSPVPRGRTLMKINSSALKHLDDLVSGDWTDLSSLVPSGLTPYFMTVNNNKLYLATFNHESTGKGDSILEFSIN